MTRKRVCAVAQMGPVARAESRGSTVARMVAMMREAAGRGAGLVVFPELALTSFFPRWWMEDAGEIDAWFETEMPSAETRPLFETAAELGIGFHLGYAERTPTGAAVQHRDPRRCDRGDRWEVPQDPPARPCGSQAGAAVPASGETVLRDRRSGISGLRGVRRTRGDVHLQRPALARNLARAGPWRGGNGRARVQHAGAPPGGAEHDHLQYFHNALSIQAGCYQNGLWALAAAKAGREEGCDLIGGSMIVAPTGEIVAQAATVGDEVITASVDLDRCAEIRRNIFNFAENRQPDQYHALTASI